MVGGKNAWKNATECGVRNETDAKKNVGVMCLNKYSGSKVEIV